MSCLRDRGNVAIACSFGDPRPAHTMPLRRAVRIGGVQFRAFQVQHSVRAPAVGYRVSANGCSFFYVPDVAELPRASEVLRRIDIYIGDGATVRRSMVRRKDGALVGHAPVVRQLGWCATAHVRRAVFTHCGSPLVRTSTRAIDALVSELRPVYGIDVQIACDGDRLPLSAKDAVSINIA